MPPVASAPATARLALPVLADLVGVLDDIADSAAQIEFPDHSGISEYDDGDEPWATLADLYAPLVASQNCHAATPALIEALVDQIGLPPGMHVDAVRLTWMAEAGSPQHWALTLDSAETGTWVLDYTARQFDPALPFPLVAPLAEWQATITAAAAREFGWAATGEAVQRTLNAA